MLAGFKTRARNFKFMLSGFPQGFLPKELTLLVQKSLHHVCEQLCKLDSDDESHKQDLISVTKQMAATQKQAPQSASNNSIENPQQSQEIKACLEELYKFVFHLEANKEMARPQADTYRGMIKHLVLQLTVDSYALHGKVAKDKGKNRLALHYFNLGLDLTLKEKNNARFEGRIAQFKEVIANLEQKERENEDTQEASPPKPGGEQSDEWDSYQQDKGDWKKKQMYD